MKTTGLLTLLLALPLASAKLSFIQEDQNLVITIKISDKVGVIGFEGQESLKDFIFCYPSSCTCQDMVSDGLSHPTLKEQQSTTVVGCNADEMTIQTPSKGLYQPYEWFHSANARRIAVSSTTAFSDSDMTATVKVDDNYTIKWMFKDDTTIEFAVLWNKKSWIGLNFGQAMKDNDIIVAQINNNALELLDFMGNGNTAGNRLDADTSKDVTLISWDIGTSTVKFRFSRKFNTNDAKDKLLEKGKNYGWAYAWSNSDMLAQHTEVKKFSVDLTADGKPQNTTPKNGSIVTMLIAVMIALIL